MFEYTSSNKYLAQPSHLLDLSPREIYLEALDHGCKINPNKLEEVFDHLDQIIRQTGYRKDLYYDSDQPRLPEVRSSPFKTQKELLGHFQTFFQNAYNQYGDKQDVVNFFRAIGDLERPFKELEHKKSSLKEALFNCDSDEAFKIAQSFDLDLLTESGIESIKEFTDEYSISQFTLGLCTNPKLINHPKLLNLLLDKAFKFPHSKLAFQITQNPQLMTFPRYDEIIEKALDKLNSMLARGVGENPQLNSFPRRGIIIQKALDHPNSRLAWGVGENPQLRSSPQHNEIVRTALNNLHSLLAQGVGKNSQLISFRRHNEIVQTALNNHDSSLAYGVGENSQLVNFPRHNEVVQTALNDPQSVFAYYVGKNSQLIHFPRHNEIIETALVKSNTMFAQGVGENSQLISFRRHKEIVQNVLDNASRELAGGVGKNPKLISFPRHNEIVQKVLDNPYSGITAGVSQNPCLISFPRHNQIISMILNTSNSDAAWAVGNNSHIMSFPLRERIIQTALDDEDSMLARLVGINPNILFNEIKKEFKQGKTLDQIDLSKYCLKTKFMNPLINKELFVQSVMQNPNNEAIVNERVQELLKASRFEQLWIIEDLVTAGLERDSLFVRKLPADLTQDFN